MGTISTNSYKFLMDTRMIRKELHIPNGISFWPTFEQAMTALSPPPPPLPFAEEI